VTEQSLPLPAMLPDALALGLLVAPRNAARVALGRVHVGAATVELALPASVCVGGPMRPMAHLFALRAHRCSFGSKFAFTAAYHVTTG
jgi:hypothetical protein